MIQFFRAKDASVFALECHTPLAAESIAKLHWLLQDAQLQSSSALPGLFLGPRREMVTPWSTNAVEITQNMGIPGIQRIEAFFPASENELFDPMLQALYDGLGQDLYHIPHPPEEIMEVEDISAYNLSEGLALSEEEVAYLEALSSRLGRKLTDTEVFGFSQVNSEHCRHKIFNGRFIIDGEEMPDSLFDLIRRTARLHPNFILSAYKDNVAFTEGPEASVLAPARQDIADWFTMKRIPAALSLKAETHNFPTTVEPFNGAATGSGGEIRDRMAGGQGSFPLAGTAVYMTSYPRLEPDRRYEAHLHARQWLYHNPADILVKASNGASDFGNKFGQPLICGSLLTFEQKMGERTYGYDKVIMLAGGIGYAHKGQSRKKEPEKGDRILVMGGDNYRIGMGGSAVSSVATGEFGQSIELNAVQRSNPEMQKRVYNALRALAELEENPVISVHDHGAGGHLNSLSELVEVLGGKINLRNLPVGDPTLSAREIMGNESQERMGLVMKAEDVETLKKIAERERAPLYDVGEVSGDQRFVVEDAQSGKKPIDLSLMDMFGKPPKSILEDDTTALPLRDFNPPVDDIDVLLKDVLQQEAVACKDWLTNKVDRSVTGRVAIQQCAGSLQLPLNDYGLMALDISGSNGIATSIGHAPQASLIDPAAGARISIAEALTNLVFAPLAHGLKGVSLSANWMWPARQEGENARLYAAVQAASDFAIALGINIPTGKDSLSMTQRYPDGESVLAPGTVIISAMAETKAVSKAVTANLKDSPDSSLLYIPFTLSPLSLGGTALSQTFGVSGSEAADIPDPEYLQRAFFAVQELVASEMVLAGHDVSAGGLITCLLEMTFSEQGMGIEADTSHWEEEDVMTSLFAERPAVVIQVSRASEVLDFLEEKEVEGCIIGRTTKEGRLQWKHHKWEKEWEINALRRQWMHTSYLLDQKQCGPELAKARYENLPEQVLQFRFPAAFNGKAKQMGLDFNRQHKTGIKAAVIREKRVNGDREMAWALHLAGMDVKDIHMTDLISGREDLSEVHFIVFVGGFSNSDVLGSARGWAGAFLYNPKAKEALERFYARKDTLSLGVCNGCQLMMALEIIPSDSGAFPKMEHNASGKFESAFLNVDIQKSDSVMLGNLSGSRLGIWVAHGEGRFVLQGKEEDYHIPVKYSYETYPGNPNGSDFNAAALASEDGRHLAIMPHLERAFLPWQWAYYPEDRKGDEISPWILAFVNAKNWIEKHS